MQQRYLVIYDIAHPRRLQRVARVMEGFGQRIQNSLFECALDADELSKLQSMVLRCIRTDEDCVQYLRLCQRDVQRITHVGQIQAFAIPSFFIV